MAKAAACALQKPKDAKAASTAQMRSTSSGGYPRAAAAVAALEPLYKNAMPSDPRARFTVGRFAVEPGSVNAIPGSVTFTVDLRHPETKAIDDLEARVRQACDSASKANGCQSAARQIFDMPPALFSDDLLACLDRAAASLGLKTKRMLSGAFHDALFVSRVAPAAARATVTRRSRRTCPPSSMPIACWIARPRWRG